MIELTKEWAIGGDNNNIILYRKATPKKQMAGNQWAIAGYYSNLQNAITALANFEIQVTKIESLKTITNKLDELCKLIKSLPKINTNDLSGKP